MSLHVIKFGGTSVGSTAAINSAIEITNTHARDNQVVVVVSAMSGVTDTLLRGAHTAAEGDGQTFLDLATAIHQKHLAAAHELIVDRHELQTIEQTIDRMLDEFRTLCHSVQVLGELTPRAIDAISSLGERMNAPLVAAALRQSGTRAVAFDATNLVITDDHFGDAAPYMDLTRERLEAELRPSLERGSIPVVTGFVGATERGATTTLGRGGSDYSAAIIGAGMNADAVYIYTDVRGVMTADPRVVPSARVIPTLSYEEIGELAWFGAKVLHPKTIRPVVERDIRLIVRSTFDPKHPGTTIVRRAQAVEGAIKAVTAIRNLSILTVAGRGMLGIPGVAARTFGAVARVSASVLMISQASSEQSICFVVPSATSAAVTEEVQNELRFEIERRDIDGIVSQNDVVIVTVVGAGMRGTPGVAGQVFGVLGRERINIHAIAQGSSECSISLVVDARDADQAVAHIHELTVVAA
jgi:bifunctional aspartokinase / homoserine dehydrogenase 1